MTCDSKFGSSLSGITSALGFRCAKFQDVKVLSMSVSLAFIATVTLGGCGGQSPEATDVVPQPTETVTISVGPSEEPPSESPAEPEPSSEGSEEPSEPPPPVQTEGGSATLGLSDAFESGGWEEGQFDPAGAAPETQAIAAILDCGEEEIEFRFAQRRGNLEVELGQDIESEDSDIVVEAALTVDGDQVDTSKFGFKEVGTLSTPLENVASVIITVAPDACSTTTALITSLKVVSP